ncbi:MAG: hypothetical protein COA79_03165 [Planctomycetota bacterium]|nr:MAG: hypothetical protein COA79_03165 [Planctomycetota bacterium]
MSNLKEDKDVNTGSILIIDDNESLLEVLEIALKRDQHKIITASTPTKGLEILKSEDIDIVLQDIRLPEMDGVELLSKIKEIKPNQIVFIMTAYSTWEIAVNAMRLGAFGYFEKKSPFDTKALRNKMKITIQKIRRERGRTTSFFAASQIIGDSQEVKDIQKLIQLIAPTESSVLIYGDSGTGKELIAKSLHYSSLRNKNSFVTFNCGEFTSTLIESELFGHVKGAFTGAIENKKGLIELAHGGTLFMDELGEMPLDMQVRLLRVLENNEVRPVGSSIVHKVDVRYIFATNKNLEEMVEANKFRNDLYYRIDVVNLKLPPLKNRIDDIPLLAGSFLNKFSINNKVKEFDEGSLNALRSYPWPGNIRELQNKIQRASILSDEENIIITDLFTADEIKEFHLSEAVSTVDVQAEPEPQPVKHQSIPTNSNVLKSQPQDNNVFEFPSNFDLEKEIERIECKHIQNALNITDGNLTKAAKILNISFRSIRYKVKKYKIEH